MPDFTKDVKEFNTTDLLDAIYGEIQAITERGKPDNVIFHYFLPPIPFGPELSMFMDLGKKPQMLENTDGDGETVFTVNDVARAAINFAALTDYIPTLGSDPLIVNEDDTTVDLNSLISSGKQVSKIYNSVLENCRVIDNSLSEFDKARLEKLRAFLYEQPTDVSPAPAADNGSDSADELDDLDALLGDGPSDADTDIDLDALLSADGLDAGDFVEDPDQLLPPTRLMKLYRALENRYNQVEMQVLEKSEQISPNDPNGGRKIAALKKQLDSARNRWETQGKKRQVEAIMAKIAVLSRGGMPEYLDRLRTQFAANEVLASVFASDSGLGFLTESAYYTALRPNGVLRAKSLMEVTLDSKESKKFHKTSKSKTAGGLKIPVFSLFAKAGGEKSSENLEESFFEEGFHLSFQIVQGVVDRPWLDVAFLESGAYTMIDPDTKETLDVVNEIVTLSDGQVPPKDGVMPAIPMTVYFVRDVVVRSTALANMTAEERRSFTGKAGVSFLGFGVSGDHAKSTAQTEWNENSASGELTLKGQFLIGMASRFLGKAPDADFESHPDAADWV